MVSVLTAVLAVLPMGAQGQAAPLQIQGKPGKLINMDEGSFLRPVTKRDSVLIGDQLEYGVSLNGIKENTGLGFADFSERFGDTLLVVKPWRIDTLKTIGKKKELKEYNLEASVTITSLEEGGWELPPIAVIRLDPVTSKVDTLVFKSQKLDVKVTPVDTTTFKVHDIKGQIRYPLTFKELLPWIGGVVALALLIWLAVWAIRKYARKGEDDKPAEPAYIIALRKLDKYRGNHFWTPEKQKAFYSGITDILREYISARYGFGAMEMTTDEIFTALKDTDLQKDLYNDLHDLFTESDFVKFAKYVLPEEDNAKVLPLAVRFVTDTYKQDVDQESSVTNAETNEGGTK